MQYIDLSLEKKMLEPVISWLTDWLTKCWHDGTKSSATDRWWSLLNFTYRIITKDSHFYAVTSSTTHLCVLLVIIVFFWQQRACLLAITIRINFFILLIWWTRNRLRFDLHHLKYILLPTLHAICDTFIYMYSNRTTCLHRIGPNDDVSRKIILLSIH